MNCDHEKTTRTDTKKCPCPEDSLGYDEERKWNFLLNAFVFVGDREKLDATKQACSAWVYDAALFYTNLDRYDSLIKK